MGGGEKRDNNNDDDNDDDDDGGGKISRFGSTGQSLPFKVPTIMRTSTN